MTRLLMAGIQFRSGKGEWAGWVRVDITRDGETVASHEMGPEKVADLIEWLEKQKAPTPA